MSRTIHTRSTIVVTKEQVSCELHGEAAILHLSSGVYYGLNATGASVWALIQTPQTVRALRDALLTDYDVDAEACERDLLALLEDLAAAGLIEVTDEAGADAPVPPGE